MFISYSGNKDNSCFIGYLSYIEGAYLLTKKELEVLKLKKQGYIQNEIANKLKISQPAVSGFYTNAVRKVKEAERVLRLVKEVGIKIEE